jgi:hypothetical protein
LNPAPTCSSQAYLALRGRGKDDASSTTNKPQAAKFLAKPKSANHSNVTPSGGSFRTDMMPELSSVNDPDIQVSIFSAHKDLYTSSQSFLVKKKIQAEQFIDEEVNDDWLLGWDGVTRYRRRFAVCSASWSS